MKVLILTNLFPTPWDPLRGAFNRQQFERLGQLHDVDVITAVDFRERLGERRGEVNAGHVHTDYFVFFFPPRIGRSLHAICWLLSLLWQRGRQIRNAHYDCMLVSWAYPDGAAVGWLARWLGIPYVVKVHGSDLNVQANYRLQRPQIRSALTGAAGVVAVSRALATKAIGLGTRPSNVHVLYNGVDTSIFSPDMRAESRARLGFSTYTPLLLFVGNLKASKGCLDLLEAFPALLAAQPLARLIYVGTGAARATLLERAKALGCLDRVEIAGAVAHAELGNWFRAADVLCLPSHNEGVPNVVLEAMACGTPVVASRVGGIPEVVPHYAGILVLPHQREALSDALIEASTRHWNHKRIAAHARGFRWEDNIRQLDAILHAAVESSAPAGASA
ncbi:glycosyltransferase family 4 protein [Dyella monticola]|uniref:Glycosyltransferase family 4 protein n=1 Tax=Dyella monticola TaxID=1927958 RepID=A0A370X5P5_9GAMM|nr:glycosyltransferase family 4 protein [Dyella monticola]RDS83652.1 glycosyltransferase family 4 protein [Dyella monticola]